MARMAVLGAGLIGIYVGGRLAAAGTDATLVGRERLMAPLRQGLRLTDLDGADVMVPAENLTLATGPEALADAELILLTVKSQHSEAAAAEIAAHARPGVPVVSFQNGVSNAARLRPLLPGRAVIAGMVPFNVAQRGPAHYHRGTAGGLVAADDAALRPFLAAFEAAGLPITLSPNIDGVMWGKLLVNLNNAINALSGVSLAKQLVQRDFRRCWALAMDEGIGLVKRAGITPIDPLPLPLKWMPLLMRLPDKLYRKVMARQGGGKAKVDPHARSSMADDLAQGRATEVDWINGEVVRLAERLGRKAPVNARLVDLVKAAERGAEPWEAAALLRELKRAG